MESPIPSSYLIGIIVALLVGVGFWLSWLTAAVRRSQENQRKLREIAEGGDLAAGITEALGEIDVLREALDRLSRGQDELGLETRESIQRVGFVRFNAFDNLGGELSFAAALLNDRGDGLVISSICGSGESRTYAKLIHEGQSEYRLSDEERRAIDAAFSPNGRVRKGAGA